MEEKDLQLLEEAKTYVGSISKWTLFFGIMTAIAAFNLFICGIFFIAAQSFISKTVFNFFPTAIIGIIYLACSIVYVFPIIYLFRTYSASKMAAEENNNEQMVLALKNLKSLFKFLGILTIVSIAACLIAVPIVVITTAL